MLLMPSLSLKGAPIHTEKSFVFLLINAPDAIKEYSPSFIWSFIVELTPRKEFLPTSTPPDITTCEEIKALSQILL